MTKPAPSSDPFQFEEAVDWFRSRIPMTDEEYDALDAELQDLAFTIANTAQADVVQQVYTAIDKAISSGTTLNDFKADVSQSLTDAWGGEDPARVENIFRTNTMSAYSAGRYEVLTEPTVKQDRPYFRLDVIEDSRTSDICRPLAGICKPQDDAFWDSHSPPLHNQCRTIITALTEAEAKDHGITSHTPDIEAQDGFGKPPGREQFNPNPDDYDPDIASILSRRLKD